MRRMQRSWVVGLVALAAGSIFSFSHPSRAASNDEASQESQMQGTEMKEENSAKTENEAPAPASEETPAAGEKDQSGDKDQ